MLNNVTDISSYPTIKWLVSGMSTLAGLFYAVVTAFTFGHIFLGKA